MVVAPMVIPPMPPPPPPRPTPRGDEALIPMRLAALALLVLVPLPGPNRGEARLVDCLAAKPRTRWVLPPDLREISGLALTDDGRLLTHDDERARIVEL